MFWGGAFYETLVKLTQTNLEMFYTLFPTGTVLLDGKPPKGLSEYLANLGDVSTLGLAHFEAVSSWFRLSKLWEGIDTESVASAAAALVSKFAYVGSSGGTPGGGETAQAYILAQLEAITHKPAGYASSPSVPGTISSPWWTDFSHLIYWFFFVATFATVVFFWYLYDFKVRRVETAHPIRETRGFSRAQTGDTLTAVLPLTWSATMIMHASTHSINFDENTGGTAFSFTVIAYQ